MKKILISILCILAFASICFANDVETVSGARTTQDFVAGDPYIVYSYVTDSGDPDNIPARVVTNNPELRVSFHSHFTQLYTRHYIVSDETGTMVYYNGANVTTVNAGDVFNGSVTPSLANGDYVFTFVAAGETNGMAVGDQFHFSVR